MEKKQIKNIILVVLFLCALVLVFGYVRQEAANDNEQEKQNRDDGISKEEQEFNDSGRAKAYDDGLSNFDALQGKWVSADDSNSMIEFKQDKKIDFYADEKVHEDDFGVYNSRDIDQAGAEDEDGKYLIVGSGDEKMEYEIIVVTNDSLALIYLDRGNILGYKRVSE